MLKQWWPSNQPISSKVKQWLFILTELTGHKTKPTTDDVRNLDSGFGHAATCGGVKHTNGALTLSFLITGSPTAMHV